MKGLEALRYARIVDYTTDVALGKREPNEKLEESFNIIEKELKCYQEIREIAKRYNWEGIISKIFNVETDKKYRELFNSAIVSIQEDYRKARALEIIKEKQVNVGNIIHDIKEHGLTYQEYLDCYDYYQYGGTQLTQEEFNLLKEVLL